GRHNYGRECGRPRQHVYRAFAGWMRVGGGGKRTLAVKPCPLTMASRRPFPSATESAARAPRPVRRVGYFGWVPLAPPALELESLLPSAWLTLSFSVPKSCLVMTVRYSVRLR